jgi:hypothetical protein
MYFKGTRKSSSNFTKTIKNQSPKIKKGLTIAKCFLKIKSNRLFLEKRVRLFLLYKGIINLNETDFKITFLGDLKNIFSCQILHELHQYWGIINLDRNLTLFGNPYKKHRSGPHFFLFPIFQKRFRAHSFSQKRINYLCKKQSQTNE